MRTVDKTAFSELAVPLYGVEGELVSILHFDSFGLAPPLASAFKDGFVALFAHNSIPTQRQRFNCIRKFASFMRSTGNAEKLPLSPTIASDLQKWLLLGGLSVAYAQSIMCTCIPILHYCERNAPHLLSKGTRLRIDSLKRTCSTPRSVPSEAAVKNTLRCCYLEIDAVEKRLACARRLLDGISDTPLEKEQAQIIRELLAIGNGKIPVPTQTTHSIRRRMACIGGFRAISQYIWLTPRDLLPFYLAMLVQTSGNPEAILRIGRNCISPHPLRADLERVVWEKPRSRREQFIEAPIGRPWSAPNLVRRLAAANENLVPMCSSRDRTRLFLSYVTVGKRVRLTTKHILYLELEQFIKTHGLEEFTFSSLRFATASAHFRVNGSLADARKRLNHVSLVTTSHYAEVTAQRDHNDAVIQRFQGLIVRMSSADTRQMRPEENSSSSREARPTETVFGFQCRNPFDGIAEGSTPGSLCLQFQKCATCPGALIPLDNIAVVAKLIAADNALQNAHDRALKEGWINRYQMVYGPTRRILTDEILPAISDDVRSRANQFVNVHLIPRLE